MTNFDPRLYLILDPAQRPTDKLIDLTREAVAGGVTLLQLRCKSLSTCRFLETAQAVKVALADTEVPLLINDRIDIALAVGAAGVHIGQDDLPVADARRLLGEQAIIGLTVRSPEEAAAASLELLDYVSIGGVFATTSKQNSTAPIGLDGLQAITDQLHQRQSNLPLTAIAGIDRSNAAEVIAAGVDGIAVISAITAAADPGNTAAELRRTVDTALTQRSKS